MSISSSSPKNITRSKPSQIISPISKQSLKKSTIELKKMSIKEQSKSNANTFSIIYLQKRNEEKSKEIERLNIEKKARHFTLLSLTAKIQELLKMNPRVIRYSSHNEKRNITVELNKIVEAKKKSLNIARLNNKMIKEEYEEFALKSSMKNELDRLKEEIENARNKKYQLIKALRDKRGEDVSNRDDGRVDESVVTNETTNIYNYCSNMNYMKKTSESKEAIREFIHKLSRMRLMINTLNGKDDNKEYNELLEAIQNKFNEINKELDGTPDDIINRIELENDNKLIVNERSNEAFEKTRNKYITFSKSSIDVKLQNKKKMFLKQNKQIETNKSQYNNNHTRTSSLIEYQDPSEIIKDKEELIKVNDDILNQLEQIQRDFSLKETQLNYQIKENSNKLQQLLLQNKQLQIEITTLEK